MDREIGPRTIWAAIILAILATLALPSVVAFPPN